MFTDDFKQTITDFEYIRPQLQKMMGGQIIGVEGTGELAQVLDMRCGIDYLLVTADGVRGIASRIQHGHCWRTFTVRASKTNGATTEYEKRSVALLHDFIYPYWTVQAYIHEGMARIGYVRTYDLYKYIWEHEVKARYTDNAKFYIVDWDSVPTSTATIFLR